MCLSELAFSRSQLLARVDGRVVVVKQEPNEMQMSPPSCDVKHSCTHQVWLVQIPAQISASSRPPVLSVQNFAEVLNAEAALGSLEPAFCFAARIARIARIARSKRK